MGDCTSNLPILDVAHLCEQNMNCINYNAVVDIFECSYERKFIVYKLTNRMIMDRLYFKFTHSELDHTCEQNINYIKRNIAVDISNYESRGNVYLERVDQ